MRVLILGALLAGIAASLTGCRPYGAGAVAASGSGARPLDNFGEILAIPKAPAAGRSPGGASPDDNFGEIL